MQKNHEKSQDAAHITPAVLTWAIDKSALDRDVIAHALKVSPEAVGGWETGTPPTWADVERLAVLLDLPFGFFWLPKPPERYRRKRRRRDPANLATRS